MTACGGVKYSNITLQWAKTESVAEMALAQLRNLGAPVEVREAPGLQGRWKITRNLIANANPDSLLDVGGFGEYRNSASKTKCINIHYHAGCQVYASGTPLPYRTNRFHTVLLETVLHHAAEHALQLLLEAVRVSRRYVIVAEDVLDRRASSSAVASYRAHDPWAVYRSSSEWVTLAEKCGLSLQRIIALDRVPLHVAREARPVCTLGFPPMQYFVFSRIANTDRLLQFSSYSK